MLTRVRPELKAGCVSDLRLEALRTHELADEEAQRVTEHLARCERCQARQATLTAELHAASAQLPALFGSRAEPPASTPAPTRAHTRRPLLWTGASLVAVAACAMLALWQSDSDGGVRTKGGPELGFYVKRGAQVFEGLRGQQVFAGDQLRFTVSSHGYTHLAILSRSSNGDASVYFPQSQLSASIDPNATRLPLNAAVELDDVIADETLYGVFCPAPFALRALETELALRGDLAAPADCALTTLALRKAARP